MPISKIKENSLASGAITEANVGADIINAQTELTETANDADFILVYDTSAGGLKKVLKSNFTLQVPTISSVSPTNALSGDGTGNYTFVITGTNFTGGSANLINSSGTAVAFDTVTVDSSTQITGVIAKSSLPGSGEPYDVKVTATNSLSTTLTNQINIDQQPVFSTASGSLGSVSDGARGSTTFTVVAADPESGGDVTYTLESGSLPAGCTLTSTSSGGVITGFDAVGSNTTSNFTIRAKDAASNITDRAFSITVNAPVSQSFTSSGTFSVPSGVTAVNVLVVAGGGGGGNQHGGGGGAGGLIYRPAFPVTPSGTVSVTVGNGGSGGNPGGAPDEGVTGQDTVFGTLTAKGGGGGGGWDSGSQFAGQPGGSGGGAAGPNSAAGGDGIQGQQAGDSGTYGFGGNGGSQAAGQNGGAGGGGAGANAVPATTGQGFPGGVGKAYTIADGTTSVYYAGGGGGGAHINPSGPAGPGSGGQGGGGNGGQYQPSPVGGQSGTANRGGGGGGSGSCCSSAGSGGKGIVIVQY